MENETTEQVVERLSRRAERQVNAHMKFTLRTMVRAIWLTYRGYRIKRIDMTPPPDPIQLSI